MVGLSFVDATKSKTKMRSEEVWVEVGNEAYTSKLKDLSRFLVGKWILRTRQRLT